MKTDAQIKRRPGPLGPLVQSLDGRRIALAGKGGSVTLLYDAQTGKQLRQFDGQPGLVLALALHPLSEQLACLSKKVGGATVTVWDIPTGDKNHALAGADPAGGELFFSPDGKLLVQNPPDRAPKIWKLPAGSALTDLTELLGPAAKGRSFGRLLFLPELKSAVTVENEGSKCAVTRWPLEGERKPVHLGLLPEPPCQLVWAAGGKRLFAVLKESVRIFEPAAKAGPRQVDLVIGDKVLAVHPQGNRLAYAHAPQQIRVADVHTGQHLCTLFTPFQETRYLLFSPDGDFLRAASAEDKLAEWNGGPVPAAANPGPDKKGAP
jgi:hypothetical protein